MEPRRILAHNSGGSIRWRYTFQPEGSGTQVIESYEVLRPVPRGLHVILRLFFGVRDLKADLNANMRTSLDRLAQITEEGPADSQAPARQTAESAQKND